MSFTTTFFVSRTGEIAAGHNTTATDALAYGKVTIANEAALRIMGHDAAKAIRLNEADPSDFIAFHAIDLVGAATRERYEAGAARWAARASTANDNEQLDEAA